MRVFEHQGTDAKSVTLRPESDESLTKGFAEIASLLNLKNLEVVVIVNEWSQKVPSGVPKGKAGYLGLKTIEQCKNLIDEYVDSYFLMFHKPSIDLKKVASIKKTWEQNHRDLVEGTSEILVITDHDWVSISFEFPKNSKIDIHGITEKLANFKGYDLSID